MAKAILLAEDSPDDEILFRHILNNSGVENPVHAVPDGAEAIAYLEGTGKFADRTQYPLPGIMVLDVKMPRVDGFAVLEWLQKQPGIKKELLTIVLTHFGDHNQIQRAYALGADSFLPKPLTREDLNNLIRHFDGHWKQTTKAGATPMNE